METKIELKENRNGLLWPYYQGEKAWSPSSLVEILKFIEYEDKQIPEFVLQRAARNGKLFHQIIQEFVQTGADLTQGSEISPKIQQKTSWNHLLFRKKQKTFR